MRKIVLVVLSLLLFLPLTMHGSSAYFLDSESIGVNISSAESSPFYDLWLTCDGASERPGGGEKVSSGVGESYSVDFGNCSRQSIAGAEFYLGTIANKTNYEFQELTFEFPGSPGIVKKLEIDSSNNRLLPGGELLFYIEFEKSNKLPSAGDYSFPVTLVAEVKIQGNREYISHTFDFHIIIENP